MIGNKYASVRTANTSITTKHLANRLTNNDSNKPSPKHTYTYAYVVIDSASTNDMTSKESEVKVRENIITNLIFEQRLALQTDLSSNFQNPASVIRLEL